MVTISVLLPTYNGSRFLRPTLSGLLSQNFTDFEVIAQDDCSTDNTVEILRSYREGRFKIFVNQQNLGYPGNLEAARLKATGKYLFLLGQDDIILPETFTKYVSLFEKHPKVGAITRPYYWFDQEISRPVRLKKQLSASLDKLVTIRSRPQDIITMFYTLDQLSGLAFRRQLVTIPFHPDIFPCHVYPFAHIFKEHPIIMVHNYNTAVRIASSQSRHLSSIYSKSPIQSWVEMIKTLNLPNFLITDFIAVNYVGLIQVRNYSSFRNFLRESVYLIKYRPLNLISPVFWFFFLGCLITPPHFLIPFVDWYKNVIHARLIPQIK